MHENVNLFITTIHSTWEIHVFIYPQSFFLGVTFTRHSWCLYFVTSVLLYNVESSWFRTRTLQLLKFRYCRWSGWFLESIFVGLKCFQDVGFASGVLICTIQFVSECFFDGAANFQPMRLRDHTSSNKIRTRFRFPFPTRRAGQKREKIWNKKKKKKTKKEKK